VVVWRPAGMFLARVSRDIGDPQGVVTLAMSVVGDKMAR
jgi:hypothetical protein